MLGEVLSLLMFGGFIWSACFMLPKAVRTRDSLAITSAVLTTVVTFLGWLYVAVPLAGL